MALHRRHRQTRTSLDFTALVDIALVLVVFFVLASQAAQSRDLPVSLPEAGTGQKPTTQTFDIVIDAHGTMRYRTQALDIAALQQLTVGKPSVTLVADKMARHGRVIEIVDALRKNGVEKIFYATAAGVEEW
jgi:biopolymer transport protein ExbD